MEKNHLTTRTCNSCNWVAFAVTREFAENEVKKFNEYFKTLSKKEQKECYGGEGASMHIYEHCMLCGGSYKNFRPSKPNDCPNGCTLNPIIFEDTCEDVTTQEKN